MVIELINTGTELLIGRTLNTHQQWIGAELAGHGYALERQVTVPDTGPAIESAAREALTRAQWVMVTGGLGPTSDDLTRDLIAGLVGVPLQTDPEVVKHLEEFCRRRGRALNESIRRQAQVPQGAMVLQNRHGTAPGMVMLVPPGRFQAGPAWLVMLPGPPRELRPMVREQLIPLLKRLSPLSRPFAGRVLRLTGIGESQVEARIESALAPLVGSGLRVAYCARPGEVDLRFDAIGSTAAGLVASAVEIALGAVGDWVFGEDEEELEQVVVRKLRSHSATLATAESCTGGFLAHRVTNVPGASEVFRGGWITYANEAKRQWLGVLATDLETHGAVSAGVVVQMAEGARKNAGSDYALAVTGIAGPGGGSEAKPVGTAYIALAGPRGTQVLRVVNPWDRLTFKQVTAQQALDLLRRELDSRKDSAPDNPQGCGR